MTFSGPIAIRKQSNGSQNYVPKGYMKRVIRRGLQQACLGLLLDPGLGKTGIMLMILKILLEKDYVKGAVVIAPLRAVYTVWPGEVKKWTEFNDLSVGILHGDDKDKVLLEDHHLYVINPEGIAWLAEKLSTMREWPFDMLIVDESTKFKDSSTKRFKYLKKMLNRFKRRYILTGTPVPNGLLDLFGQIYILDQGHALGGFITHYRTSFFVQGGYGGYSWIPQFDAMERITERMAPLTIHMAAEEYLQLPELMYDVRWTDLPADVRTLYKSVEDEFFAEIGEDTIIAPNKAAAGVKCRQILNGAVYINLQKDYRVIHDIKLKALEDLMEELSGQPLLLLYEFQHDRERILEKFPWFEVIGGQSMKKDSIVIEKFNRGEIRGVLGHPASMGHALNLQGSCCHVGWFGLTWNFEYWDQAIRRVWRQGNEAMRVVVHLFCVRNSLDEAVVQTIYDKDVTQMTFVRHVRARVDDNS